MDRGSRFKQGLKLETEAPTGLHVEPGSAMVKAGDNEETQLKTTAAKDAPLGGQKVLVKGTPDRGESVSLEWNVTVKEK